MTDLADTDRSNITMDHTMGSDCSLGSVHVPGTLLLINTREGLHV